MNFKLSVPGKTFLTGEYNVLAGGESVLLSTEPRFKLFISQNESNSEDCFCAGIHPKSSAGIYLREQSEFFKKFRLSFIDPYNGAGGFGASGAQFLLLRAVFNLLSSNLSEFLFSESWIEKVWKHLRQHSLETKSPASGADIVSQYFGGITFFGFKQVFHAQTLSWPFDDMSFLIFHTGKKIPTHEHLQVFNHQLPYDKMDRLVKLCQHSLQNKDQKGLLESVKNYYQILVENDLVIERTQKLCREIEKLHGVLACKGCGALGADTILMLVDNDQKSNLIQTLSPHLTCFHYQQGHQLQTEFIHGLEITKGQNHEFTT